MRPLFFALAAVVILWMTACTSSEMNNTEVEPSEEPFYAWDFEMQSTTGETYRLSDLRGRYVVVNFWATWCAPCRDEMPELQAIAETYTDTVLVLGVNQRETRAQVVAFAEELNLTFPLLINPPDDVLLNYQVVNLPQTIIVNPDGELVWRRFGPLNLEEFAGVLASL